MTPEQVRSRFLDEVIYQDVTKDDCEVGHINEDKLAIDVLRACADTSPLASAFLEVFDRHEREAQPLRHYV